jgi:hypothetical protein
MVRAARGYRAGPGRRMPRLPLGQRGVAPAKPDLDETCHRFGGPESLLGGRNHPRDSVVTVLKQGNEALTVPPGRSFGAGEARHVSANPMSEMWQAHLDRLRPAYRRSAPRRACGGAVPVRASEVIPLAIVREITRPARIAAVLDGPVYADEGARSVDRHRRSLRPLR